MPGAGHAVPAGLGLLGRQNWSLLFKIVLILYILCQGGDPTRLMYLTLAAFLIYLYARLDIQYFGHTR